jgi:hypothetical protein
MPLIGTPLPTLPDVGSPGVLSPRTTETFGCPANAKRKTVEAFQGQTLTLNWVVTDYDGNPLDLSTIGDFQEGDVDTGYVKLDSREAVLPWSDNSYRLDVTGSVTDLADGAVTFTIPVDATYRSGIYLCQISVFNTDGKLVVVNQFYLVVNRGLRGGDTTQPTGMPSIAEIRLHMRDSDPSENSLLDTVQFDLSELAACIERPILYWNEAQPPLGGSYSTSTFPHRFHWLEGVISQLYLIAAHWYRRNRLAVQSQGGIGVDDLNKSAEYEQIGQQKWESYKSWVFQKKVQLNAEAAMQSSFGAYASYRW